MFSSSVRNAKGKRLFERPGQKWENDAKAKGKGKGKAIPLQAWTGPEGSRRLRLPDFKTIGT
jgi:hypothetical protein